MQKILVFGKKAGTAILKYVKTTYIALWITVLTASVISCMLVYSTTHDGGMRRIAVQVIACLVGYVGAVIISTMDYERLGELWYLIAIVCIGLVLATFVFGVQGTELADDKAWLRIFGVSFQPSELMKIGFIITFSYHLSLTIKAGHINSVPHLLLVVGHGLIPIVLILAQGDTGNAMIFAFIFAFMIFCSGIDWKYIALVVIVALCAVPFVWQQLPSFQKERFRAVYFPREGDELDALYQQTIGRMALGSGGITGQGWMNGSLTQAGIIPEDYTDFIFTACGEEFGLIGCVIILLIEVFIIILSLRAGLAARDNMGKFMCLGFIALIATQTIFNIGMCLVVLPVIGITLPFISAGGSSSMCLYFGFGLVLSVYMRRNEARLRI